MISIITGDIINSRLVANKIWLPRLKKTLGRFGKEPSAWEIFRGDSFQLEVNAEEALRAAILIKATIKQIKDLDVRIAIGIGEKEQKSKKITESNGEAFVNSGLAFEVLNKKRTLSLRTPWPDIDDQLTLAIDLALLTMNTWPANAASYIQVAIENPTLTQQQLSQKLGKSQGSISESLNRAGFDDIMRLEQKFRELITSQ